MKRALGSKLIKVIGLTNTTAVSCGQHGKCEGEFDLLDLDSTSHDTKIGTNFLAFGRPALVLR